MYTLLINCKMKNKTIELELRAEVLLEDVKSIKGRLEKLGTLHSHTKRLSVMYFGMIGQNKVDIRVRVTNGEGEVVVKVGSFGAHDRVEIAESISREQFLGFVRIFSQFGFVAKVGEREIFNYMLLNNIMASLVIADTIAYVELEKPSSVGELKENTCEVKDLAERLDISLLSSESQFDELCNRLDKKVDWPFRGSTSDYEKLEEDFKKYIK